jgi:hypothetical protein
MEEEKNALDELLFIKKVIQDSRRIMLDNGLGFIVWGILITTGMLFGYIKFLLALNFDYIWAWVVIITCGWVFSYFNYYKKKPGRIETFAGKIIGNLWFSIGITISILGFGGYFSGAINGQHISGVIAVVLGAAYYISSVLYEWKWFKLVALLWWVGGFVMFYVYDATQFLLMAGLMIFGQIVPGIVCYRKYKAQVNEVEK